MPAARSFKDIREFAYYYKEIRTWSPRIDRFGKPYPSHAPRRRPELAQTAHHIGTELVYR
jgi:hypothetical protein